jgi:hypothetical protein
MNHYIINPIILIASNLLEIYIMSYALCLTVAKFAAGVLDTGGAP